MDREDGAQADEISWKPEEDAEEIILDPQQPEKTARIGSHLSPAEKEELIIFLRKNQDIFGWSPSDMPGIDPKTAYHKLHVDPAAKPVIQKRMHFAPEVAHSAWLANIVLVMKKEKGKWRVCVYYTDLNKACPNDPYAVPRIDLLVDSTSGNQLLSFLDAYSG